MPLVSRGSHGSPKPKARYALIGVAGLIFCLSGCVTKARYRKDVNEAYAKGKASAEVTFDQVAKLEKDWDAAYRENAMRDKATIADLKKQLEAVKLPKGRFIKINGKIVDLEGK